MRKKNSNPTMKDVALEAGVALGTVSKVINGLPVGEEYRQKVESAIKKLNYQVNSYAQGLKANRTNTIALLVPNTINPFFGNLVNCITVALSKRHYHTLLCCTDYRQDLENKYIAMVKRKQVDGIIGLTYNPNLRVDENTPFVSIDRCLGPTIPCISSDNFAGGQIAAEKLASLGCRHVAFMRIGSSLTNEPNKRKSGFENGCMISGMTYENCLLEDGTSMEDFYRFLQEHYSGGKLAFDGIFCATDTTAYYILQCLRLLNVKVPEEVQVIGFDGVRILSEFGFVCSTIVQPVEDIAEMCVEMIHQENMSTKPPLICLPVHYEPGGTTRD